MTILYVTEQGSHIGLKGQSLLVTLGDAATADVELHRLRALLIFGNSQISTQAARALLRLGIEVAFLTTEGTLEGHLIPPLSKNVLRRMTQYQRLDHPGFRFALARALVATKIANSAAVLCQADWDNADLHLRRHRQDIEAQVEKARQATNDDQLRGHEGHAAHLYFNAIPQLLKAPGITFAGRNKRPPRDPLNALLSFGYTLMANRIQSLLAATGWDPYNGFYHRHAWGRPTLALDLLELYRAPLVDRFAIKTLNLRILKPEDFDITPDNGARLSQPALKMFLARWHSHFESDPVQRALKTVIEQLPDLIERQHPEPETLLYHYEPR